MTEHSRFARKIRVGTTAQERIRFGKRSPSSPADAEQETALPGEAERIAAGLNQMWGRPGQLRTRSYRPPQE